MREQLTKARIYWDRQDPATQGWAYRLTWANAEDSGPLEDLSSLSVDCSQGYVLRALATLVSIHTGRPVAEIKRECEDLGADGVGIKWRSRLR